VRSRPRRTSCGRKHDQHCSRHRRNGRSALPADRRPQARTCPDLCCDFGAAAGFRALQPIRSHPEAAYSYSFRVCGCRLHDPPRRPLKTLSRGGEPELTRMAIDTTAGMVLSNVIAYFIVLATASTLHAHGLTEIQTAAEAAEALRPIAGDLTFLLFALGIIGTGLLAIPVLAGSAAYAVAETFGWPSTLKAKFPEAIGFYTIIFAATIVGFAMGFLAIDPIRLLIWTAVINGIVAVPIMAVMMLIVTNEAAMGGFRARPLLAWGGWLATALMGVTAVALLWSLLR